MTCPSTWKIIDLWVPPGNWVLETRFQIWKLSLKDSVSNRYILKLTPQTPHSLTHRLCHTDQTSLTLSLSHFSASLAHPLLPLHHHIDHFADHPHSLTLFSYSVKHSPLRQSSSSPIILSHSLSSPTLLNIHHFVDHPLLSLNPFDIHQLAQKIW